MIAAGQVAQNRFFPFSVLIDELRYETRKLDGLDTGDPYTTARSVFSWSYHALPAAAQRMFRLLGLPTAVDIALPTAASLAGVPLGQARSALIDLTRANLVEAYIPGRSASPLPSATTSQTLTPTAGLGSAPPCLTRR